MSDEDTNTFIPYNRDAERGVCGSIMADAGQFLDDALTRLREEHMFCPDTRTLFSELRAMADVSRVIEPVNVITWLRDRGKLDAVGGSSAVSEMFSLHTSALAYQQWCETLTDCLARRVIIASAKESMAMAQDMTQSWKLAMQANDSEMALLQVLEQAGQAVPMSQVMCETVDDLEQAMRLKGQIRGVRTGLPDLDRTINGLEPPDLFVIGARPGMGKTNLALRFMEELTYALVDGAQVPTLKFSLEMSRLQLGRRSLFSAAGVEQSKGKTGFLSKGDEMAIQTSVGRWQRTNLWIDDTPELSIADIRARIRAAKRKWGIKVVLLDYIQIVEPVTKQGRQDERIGIKEVVGGLKAACKQCDVIMIALAQASRGSEDQPGKRPTLRDFDGSSAIEKWADYAAFIHRPSKFKNWERLRDEEQDFWGEEERYLQAAELLLVKSRHSSEAVIQLRFVAPLARFEPVNDTLYSNNPNKRQPGYKGGDGTGHAG